MVFPAQYELIVQHGIECGMCAAMVDFLFGVRLGWFVFGGYIYLHPIAKWTRNEISVFITIGGVTHLILLALFGGFSWIRLIPFVPLNQIAGLFVIFVCWAIAITCNKKKYTIPNKLIETPKKVSEIPSHIESNTENHVTVHCFL